MYALAPGGSHHLPAQRASNVQRAIREGLSDTGPGVAAMPAGGSGCSSRWGLHPKSHKPLPLSPQIHFHIYKEQRKEPGVSHSPGLHRHLHQHSPFTGQTKNNLTSNGEIRRERENRTTEKRYENQSKWGLNSKLKSKLVVKVNEVNLKKSVNIMNCASYRLKRRLNKLQKHAYRSLTTMF